MKKGMLWLLILCQIAACHLVAVGAEETISVTVDGELVSFDALPMMEQDRVLVPLRAVAEKMEAVVGWEEETQTVTAVKDGLQVTLQVGVLAATAGDQEILLDAPARVQQNRTYVPVRFFAEAFGAKVDWKEETKTVVIFTAPPRGQSLFDKPLAEETFDLMEGRLSAKMPVGSQSAPMGGYDIMGPEPNMATEQRVLSEIVYGQRAVLYVKELFLQATDDFQKDVQTYAEELCGLKPEDYTVAISQQGDISNAVFQIAPAEPENDASLWGFSLIKTKENTLIQAAFYVNEAASKWADACDALCKSVLTSIRPGGRLLKMEEREEKVTFGYRVNVADGYVTKPSRGMDFDVWYFIKVVPVGAEQPSMGMYFGGHPSYPQKAPEGTVSKKEKGTVLKQEIEWLYYGFNPDTVDSSWRIETLVPSSDRFWVHIFINPTQQENLSEMKQMAESLHQ